MRDEDASRRRSPTTASAAPIRRGTGLRGLRDRVAALDGTLAVESTGDGGTRIVAEIPLEVAVGRLP